MNVKFFLSILFAFLFLACKNISKQQDKIAVDSSKQIATPSKLADKRQIGERLQITGDFDGDGKMDTVFESYISELTGKETFKIMDSTDWENNEALIIENKPISRIYYTMNRADTFVITREHQLRGIAFFENLGDLNGDKADELGYIIDWADMSNLNRYYIISYSKDRKWKELFWFSINESLMSDSEDLYKNNSIVMKDGNNSIKYKFYSDSATVEEGRHSFQQQ